MRTILHKGFLEAGIFGLIVFTTVPTVAQTAAPTKTASSVQVVNTTASPVPTIAQGTTNVAGSVSVTNTPNVNIANNPTVTLSSGSSVNIANTPTVSLSSDTAINVANQLDGQGNPVPLAVKQAIQPYSDSCSAGWTNGFDCTFKTVPAGKLLVLQEFDGFGNFPGGVRPYEIQLNIPAAASHYFLSEFQGTASGIDYYGTHQETHLYVTGGTAPTCVMAPTVVSLSGFTCNFSGYLVDAPQ